MNYIKSIGKNNGVFAYELETNYEYMLFDFYQLSLSNNGFSIEINFDVVKELSREYRLNAIEVFRSLKSILADVKIK